VKTHTNTCEDTNKCLCPVPSAKHATKATCVPHQPTSAWRAGSGRCGRARPPPRESRQTPPRCAGVEVRACRSGGTARSPCKCRGWSCMEHAWQSVVTCNDPEIVMKASNAGGRSACLNRCVGSTPAASLRLSLRNKGASQLLNASTASGQPREELQTCNCYMCLLIPLSPRSQQLTASGPAPAWPQSLRCCAAASSRCSGHHTPAPPVKAAMQFQAPNKICVEHIL